MADIQFYQEESDEGQDDEDHLGLEQDEYEESINPDEGLTPLQKLEKYMCSENIYSRQMVARSLLETVRIIRENREDASMVLQIMVKLSEDSEPSVRTELMEQVPHIAMFCHECPEMFDQPISTYILPVIVKYLMDNNNLVRKTSQAALLVLMEQGLIDNVSVEEHVCPVINELSSPDSMDDFRTEAVALMSKMAPLVGKDITERFFMPRFTEMCTDALFHVRKVCAANFGDMCNVVGQENTEKFLLTKFYYLCEDGVWGVRKACAECFMQVSCACSPEVRRQDLTQLFVGLVCDQSRWVRMAAFQCLGSFISTFADPSVTGLYFDDEGVLTVGSPEDFKRLDLTSAEIESTIESNCDTRATIAPLASEDLSLSAEDMEVDEDEEPEHSAETPEILQSENSKSNTEQNKSETKEADASSESNMDATKDLSETGTSVDEEANAGTSVDAKTLETDSLSSQEKSPEELRALKYDVQQHAGSSESIQNTALSSAEADKSSDIQIDSPKENDDACPVDVENIEIDLKEVETKEPADVAPKESDRISIEVVRSDSSETASVSDNQNVSEIPADSDPWSDSNIGGAQSKKSQLSLAIEKSSNSANTCTDPEKTVDLQSPEEFNTFLYWRDPLPDVDIELDLSPSKSDTQFPNLVIAKDSATDMTNSSASSSDNELTKTLEEIRLEEIANMEELNRFLNDAEAGTQSVSGDASRLHVANENTVASPVETVTNIGSVHVIGEQVAPRTLTVVDGIVTDMPDTSNLSYCPIEDATSSRNSSLHSLHEQVFAQDVIPQELLEHYLSMTDPSRAQTVDAEIAKHCAYSFPAVAYTLGRRNWNCLRDLYDTLAGDMQWKVRRTLAFSIHELALILGEELTTRDLVPIFNGFLRDLDEVRVGVLKHFADFLRLLSYKTRREYLPKIPEFLNTDNNRNWRFREDLAHQLLLLVDLYSADDISSSLAPVAFSLCEDNVSAVRTSAFRVVACLLKKFTELNDKQLPSSCVNDLVGKFAHNTKWSMRQFYSQICGSILEERALPEDKFATDMLPSLLALGNDAIPNVRITLAKTLCRNVLTSDYLTSAANPHHEDLLTTVQLLKSDKDRDVRYFISYTGQTDVGEACGEDTIPV